MKGVSFRQGVLPFVAVMDEDMKARNRHAVEESIRKHYPMTQEERRWLPRGIRLARFVPILECESCQFASEDHTIGWRFPGKICLKDFKAGGGKT